MTAEVAGSPRMWEGGLTDVYGDDRNWNGMHIDWNDANVDWDDANIDCSTYDLPSGMDEGMNLCGQNGLSLTLWSTPSTTSSRTSDVDPMEMSTATVRQEYLMLGSHGSNSSEALPMNAPLYHNGSAPDDESTGSTAPIVQELAQADDQYHSTEFSNRCPDCSETFATGRDLEEHATHERHRPWRCDQEGCNKNFMRRDTYTKHLRSHDELLTHGCSYDTCAEKPARYRNVDQWKYHMRREHDLLIADYNIWLAELASSPTGLISAVAQGQSQPTKGVVVPRTGKAANYDSPGDVIDAVKPTIANQLGENHKIVEMIDLDNDEVNSTRAKDIAGGLARLALTDPKELIACILGGEHPVVEMIDKDQKANEPTEPEESLVAGLRRLTFSQPRKLDDIEKKKLDEHKTPKQPGGPPCIEVAASV